MFIRLEKNRQKSLYAAKCRDMIVRLNLYLLLELEGNLKTRRVPRSAPAQEFSKEAEGSSCPCGYGTGGFTFLMSTTAATHNSVLLFTTVCDHVSNYEADLNDSCFSVLFGRAENSNKSRCCECF